MPAPPTHELRQGRRLGAFVLREMIGEGGFGAVYLADQEVLQREAVIKISRPSDDGETNRVETFLQEARLASRIDHPFAAHVYEFGAEPDGTLWIAMELVRGTALADMIKAGPLPRQRAIPLLTRLCEVLHTLHEQGIIHRDVKPQNVMVISRAGNMFPKLLDLGIASDVTHAIAGGGIAQPGAISSGMAGTPMYMAPEQWVNGAPISPATDVYALGVMAFEVLTGKPPFEGNTVMELATQHARKTPPPLPAEFGGDLSDVIAKAMAKRPRDRFVSALAFGEALRDASGLAIDAVDLPALDPQLRDDMLIAAPQPLAECIAMIEAARTPAALRTAVWQTTYVLTAYVGNLTLAARQRATGRLGDAPEVHALLRQLAADSLDPAQWWQLSRELVRPFADAPALYPVPELVEVFFARGSALKNALDTLLASRTDDPGAKASADSIRTYLVGAMTLLGKALSAMRFLSQYAVAVVRGGQATYWMGLRRNTSLTQPLPDAGDGILLLDSNDVLACDLSAVASCAEPTAGAARELFWLVGAHQDQAKLQALPHSLELRRDDVWPIHLGASHDDRRRISSGEAAAASDEHQPPYMGLATFGTGDADRYFGREAEVVAFVNRMQGRRLIAVVGPSGSGKSSFVQAGVLPNLPTRHQSVVLRPGGKPLEALSFAAEKCGVFVSAGDLASQPGSLAQLLLRRQRDAERATPLLWVVDQFEELVTMCLDPAAQAQFAEAMLAIANEAELDAHVIFTLRDDFLIRVAGVPGLRERLSASLHLLTTPLEEDLQRILTEPARRVGYAFEDGGLVKEIAQEVANQSAALALLSFTAFQLWQFRDQHFKQLTRKAYQALGGVGGALAHHAESVMSSLSGDEQKSVREIFRHLVTADGTRASLSRDEILQVAGGAPAALVLERLIGARLLVAQEGPDSTERIEVIHEALLNAWPRLVQWRHEDAEGARMRDQLRVAAKQWTERGRDKGLLWRGDTLTEYRLWRARYPGGITSLEEAFAAASIREALKNQRLRRVAAAVLISALIITTIIFGKLRQEAMASEAMAASQLTESIVDQGRRALLNNDPGGALMFFQRAISRHSPDAALPIMVARAARPVLAEISTISGHNGGIQSLGLSPDKTRLLTSSEDGTVRITELQSTRLVATLVVHPKKVQGSILAVWLDDQRIAASGVDGVVRVWDARSGQRLSEQPLHEERITALMWHVSTHEIVTAAMDRRLVGWNPDTGVSRLILDMRREPFGYWTVAANGDVVGLSFYHPVNGGPAWVMSAKGMVTPIPGHGSSITVTPSTDGKIAVVGFAKNMPHLLVDARTGATLRSLAGHDKPIRAVALSDDNTLVATGGEDQSIRVMEIATGNITVLRSHSAAIWHLRFVAPGRLLSLSADGTAKLWDVDLQQLLLTMPHGGELFSAAHYDGGKRVITASRAGTAKLWNTSDEMLATSFGRGGDNSASYFEAPIVEASGTVYGIDDTGVARFDVAARSQRRLITASGTTGQLALVDQGRRLIHYDGASTLQFLDPTSLAVTTPLMTNAIRLAASPQGDEFVAVDSTGVLHWYAADGQPQGTNATSGEVLKLVWSANGKTLGVLSYGHVWVFEAATRKLLSELSGDMDELWLSPDGTKVMTAELREITVWDVAGRELAQLAHPTLIITAAFAPTGDRFFVGLSEGSIVVWDMATYARLTTLPGDGVRVNFIVCTASYIYSTSSRNEALIWDTEKLRLVSRLVVTKDTLWAGPDHAEQRVLSLDRRGILTVQDIRPLPPEHMTSTWLAGLIHDRIDPEVRQRAGIKY